MKFLSLTEEFDLKFILQHRGAGEYYLGSYEQIINFVKQPVQEFLFKIFFYIKMLRAL